MPYINKPRPYKHEYQLQKKRPAEKVRRSERAAARYEYEKEHGQTNPNLVLDHIDPLSKGGKNVRSNLRLEPRKLNASFSRNPDHTVKVNKPRSKR